MENKYMEENERIRNVCKKYKSTLSFSNEDIEEKLASELWIDTKHRLAYCPNAKVKRLFFIGS